MLGLCREYKTVPLVMMDGSIASVLCSTHAFGVAYRAVGKKNQFKEFKET